MRSTKLFALTSALIGLGMTAASAQQAAPTDAELIQQGKAVYRQWCLDCHGALTGPAPGAPPPPAPTAALPAGPPEGSPPGAPSAGGPPGAPPAGGPPGAPPAGGPPGFPPAGTYVLAQRYQGDPPAVLKERTDLDPEYIRLRVRQGMGIMPPTRKSEITDAELEAIIAYLGAPEVQ